MPDFHPRPGTRTTVFRLKAPIADIAAFDAMVRTLVLDNPLGCTPYGERRKGYPPVRKVREMYTAKFEYRNGSGKRNGTSSETYDSVEGYETGIASVISNMANIAAHRGKPKHLPKSDRFSVMLRCHDDGGEVYLFHLARDRMTVSYQDEQILKKVGSWMEKIQVPA